MVGPASLQPFVITSSQHCQVLTELEQVSEAMSPRLISVRILRVPGDECAIDLLLHVLRALRDKLAEAVVSNCNAPSIGDAQYVSDILYRLLNQEHGCIDSKHVQEVTEILTSRELITNGKNGESVNDLLITAPGVP
jgi:hypothetical protein